MSGQEFSAQNRHASFLYRVFKADSIHELKQQSFTYLGSEIYFTEDGKIYRYDEPVFDFDEFHAFLQDKYEHYQLEQFILITREGQFNIRFYPLTEADPETYTDPEDDIELVGFRMFPDLLPAGTDLLLSILDKDPTVDIEGSIRIFERLLGFIQGDRDPFLRIQILMNLIVLNIRKGTLDKSNEYSNLIDQVFYSNNNTTLAFSRILRKKYHYKFYPGMMVLNYDLGSMHFWKATLLYFVNPTLENEIINQYIHAINQWEQTNSLSEDLFRAYFNQAQFQENIKVDHDAAMIAFGKAINKFHEIDNKSINDYSMVIDAYLGIYDFENAYYYLSITLEFDLPFTERFFTYISRGNLELGMSPQNALKSFESALALLDNAHGSDYDYINIFSLILETANLINNNDAIDHIHSHPKFITHTRNRFWDRLEAFYLLITEMIGSDLTRKSNLISNYLSSEISNPKPSKYLIVKVLWIFYRDVINNINDIFSITKSTIMQITRISMMYGDQEIQSLSAILIDLLKQQSYNTDRTIEQLSEQLIASLNLDTSFNGKEIEFLINYLYMRSNISKPIEFLIEE